MKKIILMLISVLSICCCIGCGSSNEAGQASNASTPESTINNTTFDKPTAEPTSESTAESNSDTVTESPTKQATTVVYEGIDMQSTLPGKEWMETFEGIMTKPKLIIFSDETGRKEIIEEGDAVKFNPDVDCIGIYLPENATVIHNKYKGITVDEVYSYECCETLKLDAESSREYGRQKAVIYVDFNGEEIALTFDFRPE